MKKNIILFVLLTILLQHCTAFAKLTVTGPNIAGREDWLDTYQSDTLVENILNDNIAFVSGSNRAWVRDKIEIMESEAVYNPSDETFSLPTSFVNSVFNINTSGAVTSSDMVAQLSKLNVFIDPRGFILFSKNENVVNTTLPTTTYSSYRDYYTISDAMGYITWEDVEFTPEERMAYIQNWKEAMTIPSDATENYDSFIQKSVIAAYDQRKNINLEVDGKGPFEDIQLDGFNLSGTQLATFKNNMHAAYKRIFTMAVGYVCMEEKDYQLRDDILACLANLHEFYSKEWDYREDSKQSWVKAQFDIPIVYGNILCLMYDEMTDETRKDYTDMIFDKAPIPNLRTAASQYGAESYTNRLWKCLSYFHVAIIANDTYRMNYAIKYSSQAFEYTFNNTDFNNLVANPDGFYDDGSMVFHKRHPYNMGYGMSYIVLIYEYLELTAGTKFDLRKIHGFENVYNFIECNILPFVTHGQTMKMTHGRHDPLTDISVVRKCAYISNHAPEPIRTRLTKKIKHILNGRILSGGESSYVINVPKSTEMKKVFTEYAENIEVDEGFVEESRVYYNSDRVIHRRENFTAGLAMSSSRIEKFEAYPPNNSYGWYLGDGMLYVYMDNKQYNINYFNKVNPYYLPGTTVDSTARSVFHTEKTTDPWGPPNNDWAGGVSDGKNSVAGMLLGNQYISGLEGRKSYFMFGDKIICIGSGITGGFGEAYTVVENRIIDKEASDIRPLDVGLEIKDITCSDNNKAETIYLVADGNPSTSTPLAKLEDWVCFDFGEPVDIGIVGMSFLYGDIRSEFMTIQVSNDGENFKDVKKYSTSGETLDIELVDVPCSGRYFKIINNGNSAGSEWFNLSEIIFYKSTATREQIKESQTIISNGFDDLYLDGVKQEPNFNHAHLVENPKWAWLEDIQGFVFMQDSTVRIKRERNPSSPVFFQMSVQHGVEPSNEKYAYVMLPKATLEETYAFAENPDIEILSDDNSMHAVYDKSNNIIGANIMRRGMVLDSFEFQTPCSVMIDKSKQVIYISDPTFTQQTLSIVFPENISIEKSKHATVNGNNVTIDIGFQRGKTYILHYNDGNSDTINSEIRIPSYNLKMSDAPIITKLYGKAENNEKILFEIKQQPSYGRALLLGDILYYYPSGGITDVIVITAKTVDGKSVDFDVSFHR